MKGWVYNVMLLVGLALIGAGLSLVAVWLALVVCGALVLALTIYGTRLTMGSRDVRRQ